MNFSVWQWRVIFVLDVLIKASLMYATAVMITLGLIVLSGFGPLMPVVLMAASLSALHLLSIFFGNRFADRVEGKGTKLPAGLKFWFVLIFSNILFVVSFALILSLGRDVSIDAVIGSLYAAATNPIPILLVAGFGYISRLIKHSH
jgi:hypothetical protein